MNRATRKVNNMAKLTSNGTVLAEMVSERECNDGADADQMTLRWRITRRAMSSGFILVKRDTWSDYGFGNGPTYHAGTWKRDGKIKAHLLSDQAALVAALELWASALRKNGWTAQVNV